MYGSSPSLCWSKHTLSLVVLLLSVNLHAAVVIPEQAEISCDADAGPCVPNTIQPSAGQTVSVNGRFTQGRLPVAWLIKSLSPPAVTDWQLVLSRLVLDDVELNPPIGSSPGSTGPVGPTLWPLNAFQSVGTALVMQDVRLVIPSTVFRQYLEFFRAEPSLQSNLNTTLHTDERTFLHITSWASGSTTLQSVTLMTGPCAALFSEARAEGSNLSSALAPESSLAGGNQVAVDLVSGGSRSGSGCNVYTADNQTVLPLLLDQGALVSREALLVLLQGNVSIAGVQQTPSGRIKLGRPVVLAGLRSVLTGVDFRMTPNILDVTGPLARVAFSCLVLENNPTGDVTTTMVAAPFSPIATVNLYSIFCSRANASKPCTILQNVTLVLSSQTEFDYIGYMYTMFNSQAPGARQLTVFYTQDLQFTSLNFTVGPAPNSLTVYNATSVAWRMLDTVYTTRPALAQPLPLPNLHYLDFEVSKAAPLALQVHNCADLKAAVEYTTIPSRLHMVLLRENLSLARSGTQQVTSIKPAPTAGMPNLVDGPSSLNITEWPFPQPSPSCLGERPLVAYRTQIQGLLAPKPGMPESLPIVMHAPEVHSNNSLVHPGFATLSFAYVRNGLFVPGEQKGLLTFQNLLLKDLPQGGSAEELSAAAQLPAMLPPQAWTLLVWAVNSTLSQRALAIHNCAIMLPEPEYQHLAALARLAKAFVIEVAGHEDALTFKDATEHTRHIHVGVFEGPGLLAENITLLPDVDAHASLTRSGGGYWWPVEYVPQYDRAALSVADRRAGSPSSVLLPAVLVPVVAAVVLAAAVAAVLLRRRHLRKLQEVRSEAASDKPPPATEASFTQSNFSNSHRSSYDNGSRPAGSSSAVAVNNMGDLILDVDQLLLMQSAAQSAAADGHANEKGVAGSRGLQPPLMSPHGNHRMAGCFPVIEGMPVRLASSSMGSGGSSLRSLPRLALPSRNSSPTSRSSGKKAAPEAATAAAPAAATAPVEQSSENGDLASTVASGLDKWRLAVSSTTMQLAERRLAEQRASALTAGGLQHLSNSVPLKRVGGQQPELPGASSFSSSCCQELRNTPPQDAAAQQAATAAATAEQGAVQKQASGTSSSNSLVLKRVLGRGSFGQVWLGVWRGISVAVKVMHLPTCLLLDPQQDQEQQPALAEALTPPHFAVMEAVLSSQCSHPNVVQVYNYMLTPLLTFVHNNGSGDTGTSSSSSSESQAPTVVAGPGGLGAAEVAKAAAAAAAAAAGKDTATLSGWTLKLIMELCDQGTLRSALDRGVLKLQGAPFADPTLVLILARDVAAALLHLHSEGIVHGDLKAANVLLATAGAEPDSAWGQALGRRLVAKVADFGLAVPLGPTQTHASLTARGTPSHMAPESFMHGHVSKAGDVFAYAVLLHELITGRRAYTGVPLPLLPHEVAVKGLRPEWPQDLPAFFRPLQQLAEACWVHTPEDRPVFAQILEALDSWIDGNTSFHPDWLGAALPEQPGPPQQQQQRRQWRRTVCHAAAAGPDPGGSSVPQAGGTTPAGNRSAAPPRASQMDWSEVSFEATRRREQ